jgi:glycosyltransferase involved in cell wall biosynthesis
MVPSQTLDNSSAAKIDSAAPLRILAVVNVAWDPRFGASRVWIELAEEWQRAGHLVEKFCLTDAFPIATSSSALAAFRLLLFPFRAARFVRGNASRFDVIDALVGTLPFSKASLRFGGLLVARSVGLYYLYEKFERSAAKRWPPVSKGKLIARPFYRYFNKRARTASDASVRHCDLLNLPNSDEVQCARAEIDPVKRTMMQPYGVSPARGRALAEAAAPTETRWATQKIVFVGMWSARKGAKDWGQIVRRIRARLPAASFRFLGTMVENQTVWNDLGLERCEFVDIVPYFDPDELPKLLSDCAVGAFPSYVEGFGMAVVEQLAAGLPTVAYDAPGPRDILRPSLPELLTPLGDPEKFSEVITDIFDRGLIQYQELSERSIQTAQSFSWPEIARNTIGEYRERLREVKQVPEISHDGRA